MTSLTHAAMASTFDDVELLIYDQLHKTLRATNNRHVPFEDLLGECLLAFIIAWHEYEPARHRCAFSTYVGNRVRYAILEAQGNAARRSRGNLIEHPDTTPAKHRWSLDAFAAELTEDARIVVQLVLEGPAELSELLDDRDRIRLKQRRKHRWKLRRHLAGLDWTVDRIMAAFNEVQEALCS